VELDFSRYGETLFEVLFAGGRMAAGGNVVSEKENKRLDFTVRHGILDPQSCSLQYSACCSQQVHNEGSGIMLCFCRS